MFDVKQIRNDFPMLKNHIQMHGHDLVYLDNNATTLKPQCVIDAVSEYYSSYSVNAERGDYDLSHDVDVHLEEARDNIKHFINAEYKEEIVFTSGTTDGLNMIAYGWGEVYLKKDDEILLSLAEHASNTLPWFDIAKKTGAKIRYIPLDNGMITMNNVKKSVNSHTKIISLALVTNVLGYYLPIKEICRYAHSHGILVVGDGAQSVPHSKTDVRDMDVDFLAFSGHKMLGPTGIGVLYGKRGLLERLKPYRYGGGSNARYNSYGELSLKEVPYRFESGTLHIAGAIGLGAAVRYLEGLGMNHIADYEKKLRDYAINKLEGLNNVDIYNKDAGGAIAMNIKNVFSQDAASLFNTYGIAVRAGDHCAKILKEYLQVNSTVRVSFYLYNTYDDIDKFIDICKKGDDFLDAFFG